MDDGEGKGEVGGMGSELLNVAGKRGALGGCWGVQEGYRGDRWCEGLARCTSVLKRTNLVDMMNVMGRWGGLNTTRGGGRYMSFLVRTSQSV